MARGEMIISGPKRKTNETGWSDRWLWILIYLLLLLIRRYSVVRQRHTTSTGARSIKEFGNNRHGGWSPMLVWHSAAEFSTGKLFPSGTKKSGLISKNINRQGQKYLAGRSTSLACTWYMYRDFKNSSEEDQEKRKEKRERVKEWKTETRTTKRSQEENEIDSDMKQPPISIYLAGKQTGWRIVQYSRCCLSFTSLQ